MEKRNILVEFVDILFVFLTAIVVLVVGLLLINVTFDFVLSLTSKFL